MIANLPQAVDLKVSDVVVLIDREQGGESRLAADHLHLHAAFPLSFILEVQSVTGGAAFDADAAPSDRLQTADCRPCLETSTCVLVSVRQLNAQRC